MSYAINFCSRCGCTPAMYLEHGCTATPCPMKAPQPEAVAHPDTERLFYVCDGFDGFDDLDFHEEAANQAWGKEPTKEHYLAAYRKIVDAMILRKKGEIPSPMNRDATPTA